MTLEEQRTGVKVCLVADDGTSISLRVTHERYFEMIALNKVFVDGKTYEYLKWEEYGDVVLFKEKPIVNDTFYPKTEEYFEVYALGTMIKGL